MNFVHISDVHFDEPFKVITDRANLGQERRLEQRKAFKKAIEYAKEKKANYVFITGDLFDASYVTKSTVEFVNNCFKEIEDTKVYMVPGNHDPYTKDSFYNIFDWNDNVTIFKDKIGKIENDDCTIYGFGFTDFEKYNNELKDIIIDDSKTNILLTHGMIVNGNVETKYNPINIKDLERLNFDYVGIGHIHKRDDYYPGSLISLGFDELGEHGFIYGEIINKSLKKEFIKADEREFVVRELDVSSINSEEELIEKINEIKTNNNFYEINLVGERSFYINLNMKLIKEDIIKIKNNSKVKTELKENNSTLKGLFIKKLNERLKNEEITEEIYESTLETGLRIFDK